MKIKDLFTVKREERKAVMLFSLWQLFMQIMVVARYWNIYSTLGSSYFKPIVNHFHISGFDPLTYIVVYHWRTAFNITRHPLLAFFYYPVYLLNEALKAVTGVNCMQILVAAVLFFCAVYTFLFLYRLLHEVVELPRTDATLLSVLMYSFAFVMVASCAPDHFALSLFMLMLVLYISGMKMKHHLPLGIGQTVLLFLLTAGISLNNGLKVFAASLFTNRRRFFRPANLLLAVVLPSAALWWFARYEYNAFQAPRDRGRAAVSRAYWAKERQKILAQTAKEWPGRDSAALAKAADSIVRSRKDARRREQHRQASFTHQGKPIRKGGLWSLTDMTTNRWESAVENLFGESLLLHQDHLLGDTLRDRPVIVKYRWKVNYVVEGLLMFLFLWGIWYGRRSRLLWLALTFFALDMMVHFVLGFGLNEIYIMSPQWAFVYPVAIAFLLKARPRLRWAVGVLALYLFIYNLSLVTHYFIL